MLRNKNVIYTGLLLLGAAVSVLSASEQIERIQYKRIADPLYINQWHLHSHTFSIDSDRVTLNATGAGITIAIVDDAAGRVEEGGLETGPVAIGHAAAPRLTRLGTGCRENQSHPHQQRTPVNAHGVFP